MSRAQLIEALMSMSGATIAETDYVGFFVNEHGERLIFVQRRGEQEATLLHSDLDWRAEQIQVDALSLGAPTQPDGPASKRPPTVGDVILDQSEAFWLAACFDASSWLRDKF